MHSFSFQEKPSGDEGPRGSNYSPPTIRLKEQLGPESSPSSIGGALHLIDSAYQSPFIKQLRIAPQSRDFLAANGFIDVEVDAAQRPSFAFTEVVYYEADRFYHERLWECAERLILHGLISQDSEILRRSDMRERADRVDFFNAPGVAQLKESHKNLSRQLTRLSTESSVLCTDDRYLRLSETGAAIIDLTSSLNRDGEREAGELAISIFLKYQKLHNPSPDQRRILTEHLVTLAEIGSPERHFRKLYLAIAEKRAVDTLTLAASAATAAVDQRIVEYLAAPDSTTGSDALHFLKSREGARLGPPPFRRSSPGYDQTIEQSLRIVTRARREAATFHYLAQETKRLPDGSPALFSRFMRDSFDEVQGIYSSDTNIAPGGGYLFQGARLDKLFFQDTASADISAFRRANREWLARALPFFESTTYAYLRGVKIAINPHPFFRIDGVPYCYLVFNDHQNSSYLSSLALPLPEVAKRLSPSLFDLQRGPTAETADISVAGFNAHNLYHELLNESQSPLHLSGMSTLFAGCAFAFPPESSPHFTWEEEMRHTLWRDAEGHVHASFRIWDIRSYPHRVDSTLKPLQDLTRSVSRVIIRYQQLMDLMNNRYAAWKCDQTPGPVGPPMMLQEAYRWFRAAPGDENAPILTLADRTHGTENPIPIIDCRSMEIFSDGRIIQLPKSGTGSENPELSLWNRYVRPMLRNSENPQSENVDELILMSRSYLTETP